MFREVSIGRWPLTFEPPPTSGSVAHPYRLQNIARFQLRISDGHVTSSVRIAVRSWTPEKHNYTPKSPMASPLIDVVPQDGADITMPLLAPEVQVEASGPAMSHGDVWLCVIALIKGMFQDCSQ